MAPLFRKLAQNPEIDLMVYFCWDSGVGKATYDSGFGKEIKWDVPVLDGYNYKLLPNFSLKPSSKFFGHLNPSIIKELFNNNYNALWVHGYNSLTNWLAFFAAWINRTPIFLRGESHLLNYRPRWKRTIKSVLFKLLFKNISRFLVVGSANREYYKYYKISDKKIFSVPYAVDNDFFDKELFDFYSPAQIVTSGMKREVGRGEGRKEAEALKKAEKAQDYPEVGRLSQIGRASCRERV